MQFSKITSRKLKQATNNADDGVSEAKTERMPPYSKSKLAFDIKAALRDLFGSLPQSREATEEAAEEFVAF
jgi:hypothetical protein